MERVAEFLQTNAYIIVVMFVLSAGKIAFDIIARRKQLWHDFLSRKITLPVYVCLILIFLVLLLKVLWPVTEMRPKSIRTIENEEFGIQRVIVDGKRFVNCKFHKTELVFRGEAKGSIEGGVLDHPQFTFDGPAAATAQSLSNFYKIPQLRPLIDNTFEAIKKGQLQKAVPPSDAADD